MIFETNGYRYFVEAKPGELVYTPDVSGRRPPPNALSILCDYCERPSNRGWGRNIRACSIRPFWDPRNITVRIDFNWWFACVHCHALIDERRTDLLTARVAIMLGLLNDQPKFYRWLYEALDGADSGESAYWEAGQPWPPPKSA